MSNDVNPQDAPIPKKRDEIDATLPPEEYARRLEALADRELVPALRRVFPYGALVVGIRERPLELPRIGLAPQFMAKAYGPVAEHANLLEKAGKCAAAFVAANVEPAEDN